ncbi:hypothetical protein [Clostridium perfringens]|uniref:hypothetical protein n=1 Tax=Clostridium perfringens TaxID=1502 RepID=UPI003A103533
MIIIKDNYKEWSIKISLFEREYIELLDIAEELDISIKKLLNKSIKYSLNDFKRNRVIRRTDKISIHFDDTLNKYSFTIKDKHYEKLKEISNDCDIRLKELVRNIFIYYSRRVKESEDLIIRQLLNEN